MGSMGITKSLEEIRVTTKCDARSSVNDDVVDHRVEESIERRSNRDWDEHVCRCHVEADREEHHDKRGEEHWIEVVELETSRCRSCGVLVMTAMERQPDSMHHPAVEGVGDRLHSNDRGESDEQVPHCAYGSRCQANY